MGTCIYMYVVHIVACVLLFALSHPRRNVRALSIAVDRVRFGLQAFNQASAFNANIGAWNTASVITLSWVCAASARRAPSQWTRSADLRCGAAIVCGGTAELAAEDIARTRGCVRTRFLHSLAWMSACLYIARHKHTYINVYVSPCIHTYIHIYLYMYR